MAPSLQAVDRHSYQVYCLKKMGWARCAQLTIICNVLAEASSVLVAGTRPCTHGLHSLQESKFKRGSYSHTFGDVLCSATSGSYTSAVAVLWQVFLSVPCKTNTSRFLSEESLRTQQQIRGCGWLSEHHQNKSTVQCKSCCTWLVSEHKINYAVQITLYLVRIGAQGVCTKSRLVAHKAHRAEIHSSV